MMLFVAVFLVLGLTAMAFAHPDITLKDAQGNDILDPGFKALAEGDDPNIREFNLAPAYSAKMTCGTCHDGVTDHDPDPVGEKILLSYDQIEKHSYHFQQGSNNLAEFNPLGMMPWAQSRGMFGKW